MPEPGCTIDVMNPAVFNWGPVAVIVGGYLLGIYFQNRSSAQVNKRIDDLRNELHGRFTDTNGRLSDMNNRFSDMNNRISRFEGGVDNRFSDLRDFIHSEIRRVEDRIDRLERPILRS